MTVSELCRKAGLEEIALPDPDRKVCGGYVGDLLSWVMSRAQPDNVWVTIMTNINIVAVAHLADIAVVIIAEGAEIDGDVIKKAIENRINILRGKDDAFSLVSKISRLIG